MVVCIHRALTQQTERLDRKGKSLQVWQASYQAGVRSLVHQIYGGKDQLPRNMHCKQETDGHKLSSQNLDRGLFSSPRPFPSEFAG